MFLFSRPEAKKRPATAQHAITDRRILPLKQDNRLAGKTLRPNPNSLARTVEYSRIPRSVLTVCLGKSTYARCGIIVNVTPFEPEWEGYATLGLTQTRDATGQTGEIEREMLANIVRGFTDSYRPYIATLTRPWSGTNSKSHNDLQNSANRY